VSLILFFFLLPSLFLGKYILVFLLPSSRAFKHSYGMQKKKSTKRKNGRNMNRTLMCWPPTDSSGRGKALARHKDLFLFLCLPTLKPLRTHTCAKQRHNSSFFFCFEGYLTVYRFIFLSLVRAALSLHKHTRTHGHTQTHTPDINKEERNKIYGLLKRDRKKKMGT
jgi:hypothetical protein